MIYFSRSDLGRDGRLVSMKIPAGKAAVFLLTVIVAIGALPAGAQGIFERNKAVIEHHKIPHGPLPERHQMHASTITEARDGTLLAAWFGGTKENNADVAIWLSRKPREKQWSEPVMVDDGSREVNGKKKQFACWNPVLFTHPKDETIYLWYKITGQGRGPGYKNWWGAIRTSDDNGKTWSNRIWLPEVDRAPEDHKVFEPYNYRATGPVKNRPVVMPDGALLCGSSTESPIGWKSHFEHYRAGDWTGQKHGVKIYGPIMEGRSIQPSFIILSEDKRRLGVFLRDDGYAESEDGGRTWTKVLDSPVKTSRGLHAVTTANNVHFLAFNPSAKRTPLSLARSTDGENWEVIIKNLWSEGDRRMDYPTIMQARDGKLHVTHSFGRECIHHIVLDTEYIEGEGEDLSGPLEMKGKEFTVARVDNGAAAFSNRDYRWTDVPGKICGLRLTRTGAGVRASITVTARRNGTVHIATVPAQEGIDPDGWERVPGLMFCYTDKDRMPFDTLRRLTCICGMRRSPE